MLLIRLSRNVHPIARSLACRRARARSLSVQWISVCGVCVFSFFLSLSLSSIPSVKNCPCIGARQTYRRASPLPNLSIVLYFLSLFNVSLCVAKKREHKIEKSQKNLLLLSVCHTTLCFFTAASCPRIFAVISATGFCNFFYMQVVLRYVSIRSKSINRRLSALCLVV